MFYLLIEVRSYRQLKRTQPRTAAEVDRSLEALAGAYKPVGSFVEDGYRIYAFPEDSAHAPSPIVPALKAVRRFFVDRALELYGYVLLVDAAPDGRGTGAGGSAGQAALAEEFRRLKRLAGRTTEDSLYCTPAAMPSLASTFAFKRHADLYVSDLSDSRSERDLPNIGRLAARPRATGAVLDALESIVNTRSTETPVLVHGGELSAAQWTVETALAELVPAGGALTFGPRAFAGSDTSREPEHAGSCDLAACLRALPEPTHTVRQAGGLWRRLMPSLCAGFVSSEPFGDVVASDLLTLAQIAVDDYIKRCQGTHREPIIVVEQVDRLDPLSLTIIDRLLEKNGSSSRMAAGWVFTATATTLPARLRVGDVRRVPVPPMTSAEISQLLPGEDGVESRRITDGEAVSVLLHALGADRSVSPSSVAALLSPVASVVCGALTVLEGLLSPGREREVFVNAGHPAAGYLSGVRELADLGLVRGESNHYLNGGNFGRAVSKACARSRQDALSEITAEVERLILSAPTSCEESAHFAHGRGGELFLGAYERYSRKLVESRPSSRVSSSPGALTPSCLESVPVIKGAGIDDSEGYARLIFARRLQAAVASSDSAGADTVVKGWDRVRTGGGRKRFLSTALLARGQYALLVKDIKSAVALTKQAIIRFQDEGDGAGLVRAHLLFAQTLLARESLSEARDYLAVCSKAEEASMGGSSPYILGRLEMLTSYLYGNLTRVSDLAEGLERRAVAEGQRQWELFFVFIRGRVLFELGRYSAATELFAGNAMGAASYGLRDCEIVSRNWMGRAIAYDGRQAVADRVLRDLPHTAEVRLFLGEVALLSDRYDDAVELALSARTAPATEVARPIIAVANLDWTNGFAAFDDLAVGALSGKTVIGRLAAAVEAFAVAKTGSVEDSIPVFRSITRGGDKSVLDPNAWLYLYLYSLILPDTSPDADSRLTILGRSVRHSQERNSRIERYADKVSFQRSNLWNRRLLLEAGRHNLV